MALSTREGNTEIYVKGISYTDVNRREVAQDWVQWRVFELTVFHLMAVQHRVINTTETSPISSYKLLVFLSP
jgi:hypothetical protein